MGAELAGTADEIYQAFVLATPESQRMQRDARPESGRLVQGNYRPATRLDFSAQSPARGQRQEKQLEAPPVRVASKFEQQFFLAAGVKPERNVGDAPAATLKLACQARSLMRLPPRTSTL
jgi:hypothetical protein